MEYSIRNEDCSLIKYTPFRFKTLKYFIKLKLKEKNYFR